MKLYQLLYIIYENEPNNYVLFMKHDQKLNTIYESGPRIRHYLWNMTNK